MKAKQGKEKEEQENQALTEVITQRREAGEKVDENYLMEQLRR